MKLARANIRKRNLIITFVPIGFTVGTFSFCLTVSILCF